MFDGDKSRRDFKSDVAAGLAMGWSGDESARTKGPWREL